MESVAHVLHWAFHTVRTYERAGDGKARHVVDVRVPVERQSSIPGRRGAANKTNRLKRRD